MLLLFCNRVPSSKTQAARHSQIEQKKSIYFLTLQQIVSSFQYSGIPVTKRPNNSSKSHTEAISELNMNLTALSLCPRQLLRVLLNTFFYKEWIQQKNPKSVMWKIPLHYQGDVITGIISGIECTRWLSINYSFTLLQFGKNHQASLQWKWISRALIATHFWCSLLDISYTLSFKI